MNQHEKLNYVEFPCKDLAATKSFFQDAFGRKLRPRSSRPAGRLSSRFLRFLADGDSSSPNQAAMNLPSGRINNDMRLDSAKPLGILAV